MNPKILKGLAVVSVHGNYSGWLTGSCSKLQDFHQFPFCFCGELEEADLSLEPRKQLKYGHIFHLFMYHRGWNSFESKFNENIQFYRPQRNL
jgi:hypothetical protein